ncbi:hypothetical protein STAL104432_29615 [Streptomyces albus]
MVLAGTYVGEQHLAVDQPGQQAVDVLGPRLGEPGAQGRAQLGERQGLPGGLDGRLDDGPVADRHLVRHRLLGGGVPPGAHIREDEPVAPPEAQVVGDDEQPVAQCRIVVQPGDDVVQPGRVGACVSAVRGADPHGRPVAEAGGAHAGQQSEGGGA